jgi:hypothetical protein
LRKNRSRRCEAASHEHRLAALGPLGYEQVMDFGGGPTTAAGDIANAILQAEVWSPATETWTRLGLMSAPRLYHSNALLMPDGRVMISGGGRFDVASPDDQYSAEFFAPPYLFKGPRPVITSTPSGLQYGQVFTVQTTDTPRSLASR